MTRVPGPSLVLVAILTMAGTAGCRLQPPDVPAPRMIEPQLLEPTPTQPPASASPASLAGEVIAVRLLETQARAHLGRRLLHKQLYGELVEDPVWRWTSSPDRYFDSTLRLAMAASGRVRQVDTGNAATMAVTLLEWHVEAGGTAHLVGTVELQITRTDRTVRTEVVRGTEAVSGELPGDLAPAAGRLLQSLVSQCLTRVAQALR